MKLRDERGVTGAIVAISLVVLLGMLALSADFGLMFFRRRAMVNANDAAALAFAESCAIPGMGNADAMADQLAVANEPDATRDGPAAWPVTGTCSPGAANNAGRVTVTYQMQQSLLFGRIVGFGDVTVKARATATWGAAGAAGDVLPFMLSMGRLTTCNIPNTPVGTDCYFYENNKDVGNAQWSMLNVQPDPNQSKWGWNVPGNYSSCPTFSTSELQDIIANGSPYLPLNYPNPTYVCVVTGVKTPVWRDLSGLIGQVRSFPVNNPAGQVDKNGRPAPPPATPDKYDIVGFTVLKITGVWNGNDRDWNPNCPGIPDPNAWCFRGTWQGYRTGGADAGGGQNFGLMAIQLVG